MERESTTLFAGGSISAVLAVGAPVLTLARVLAVVVSGSLTPAAAAPSTLAFVQAIRDRVGGVDGIDGALG